MLELFAAGHSCFFFLFFGFSGRWRGSKTCVPSCSNCAHQTTGFVAGAAKYEGDGNTNQSMTSTLYHPDAKPTDNIPNVAPPTQMPQRMMCSAGASPEGVQGLRFFFWFLARAQLELDFFFGKINSTRVMADDEVAK